MRLNNRLPILAICVLLLATGFVSEITAQNQNIAIQRGYRTGYSDGYMAGYRDSIDGKTKEFGRHEEYKKADRSYNKDFGTIEQYRDGYQQGFESGYDTGFDRRTFQSALPNEIKFRGAGVMTPTIPAASAPKVIAPKTEVTLAQNLPVQPKVTAPVVEPQPVYTQPVAEQPTQVTDPNTVSTPVNYSENRQNSGEMSAQYQSGNIIIIPRDIELMIEIQDDISTEKNREGDRFTAKIVSPSEVSGAIIEGRISKITKPGRIKRRSEMTLSFDRIVLNDQRWSNFSATLIEVMPVKGDNIKTVDVEGTAVGKSSLKSDAIKVGAATGTGVVIGAIAGGPVGAVVGGSVGAAFGVGAVVIERGKHINLNRNQQMRIKTSYETQIR